MIIFAAALQPKKEEVMLLDNGMIPHVFGSFADVFYRGGGFERMFLHAKNSGSVVVIDSGAHTFFGESDSVSSASSERPRRTKRTSLSEYVTAYLRWADANRNCYDYIVELDIGSIVGQRSVEGWREQMRRMGLARRLWTVYHPAIVSRSGYDEMLSEAAKTSGFVGLEGDHGQAENPMDYTEVCMSAYAAGVAPHGFAMTKMRKLLRYPFASVDSSSWKSGCRFGRVFVQSRSGMVSSRYMPHKNRKATATVAEMARGGSSAHVIACESRLRTEDKWAWRYEAAKVSLAGMEIMRRKVTDRWRKAGVDWDRVLESAISRLRNSGE